MVFSPIFHASPGSRRGHRLLHVAGAVSLAGWLVLAWRSHGGGAALVCVLVVLGIAWLALALASSNGGASHGRAILLWALAFRVTAFWATPVIEDDHYRFLWDGYRFATTGNPYGSAPASAFSDATLSPGFRAVLDRINYPDVPTVYGPLCEWGFRAAYIVAPAKLWPWKLILLVAEASIVALLWSQLSPCGRLLLAWCPLTIFESGFNAHPDMLAIAWVIAAWSLDRKGRPAAAAVAIGLAVATKVFAVFILPFLAWRWRKRQWALTIIAAVALYLPFWIRGGLADLGGLRAMAGDWEFNSSVFAIVSRLSSRGLARIGCGILYGAIWLALLERWVRPPFRSAGDLPPGEWIFGWFLLLSATANPWYCLWLWPFVARRPTAAGVGALVVVCLAYVTGLNLGDASLGNFEHPGWLRPIEFGSLLVLFAWSYFGHHRRASRRPQK